MEILLEQQKETFSTIQARIYLASSSTVFDSKLTPVIQKKPRKHQEDKPP